MRLSALIHVVLLSTSALAQKAENTTEKTSNSLGKAIMMSCAKWLEVIFLNVLGWRYCVCGTLNHKEGGETNDKAAKLMNIHERCTPREENEKFHAEVLKCSTNNATNATNLPPEVCQLGSCHTDGYCFKWLVKEEDTISTIFG